MLDLSFRWQGELEKIIHKYRMEWEPWVIGAESYQEFKQKVQKMGFSNVPLSPNPMIGFDKMIMENTNIRADELPCQKRMLRRKRD